MVIRPVYEYQCIPPNPKRTVGMLLRSWISCCIEYVQMKRTEKGLKNEDQEEISENICKQLYRYTPLDTKSRSSQNNIIIPVSIPSHAQYDLMNPA
jgi:hypothetical protein